MSAWIKCSERMPPDGTRVLAYRPDNAPYHCEVDRASWVPMGTWVHGENYTHWMPLPEPPSQLHDSEEKA